MATVNIFKNKRHWQVAGAFAFLSCVVGLPTMVFAAHIDEVIREWQSIRQQYGPGTAYGLIAVFAALSMLFAVPGAVLGWKSRGNLDWLIGKDDDDASEG